VTGSCRTGKNGPPETGTDGRAELFGYVGRLVRDRRETFIPLTHPPGRRLEADFGHIYVDFPDGRRQVSVLLLTWSHSGYRFAVALPSERTKAILAGMVQGFEFFGCVPWEVWWDNPTTVATVFLEGRQRRVLSRYAALASHYCFDPRFCMPARGNEKPAVEHSVYDLQRDWATPVPRVQGLAELNAYLRSCALHEVTDGQVVAIDGKTLRRSFDTASGKAAIHMVNAWATVNHISLGQIVVDEKSNEITAIPKLLEMLELSGALVTIDAMGCQREIAEQTVASGADSRRLLTEQVRQRVGFRIVASYVGGEAVIPLRQDLRDQHLPPPPPPIREKFVAGHDPHVYLRLLDVAVVPQKAGEHVLHKVFDILGTFDAACEIPFHPLVVLLVQHGPTVVIWCRIVPLELSRLLILRHLFIPHPSSRMTLSP